jgi:thymidylate synthase (FAD)
MITVEFVDYMGSDLAIANDARVSFNKTSTWDHLATDSNGKLQPVLRKSDQDIIIFLATGLRTAERNAMLDRIVAAADRDEARRIFRAIRAIATHWAPFAHSMIKVRVTAPFAIARQLWKSHIGLACQDENLGWSEVSRRYIDSTPGVYVPETWRAKAADVKQGSSSEGVLVMNYGGFKDTPDGVFDSVISRADWAYEQMLEAGICPEQARFNLTMAHETTWIWTGSVAAFSRIVQQRSDDHAQQEAQDVAALLDGIIRPLFPVSWAALQGELI